MFLNQNELIMRKKLETDSQMTLPWWNDVVDPVAVQDMLIRESLKADAYQSFILRSASKISSSQVSNNLASSNRSLEEDR